MNRNSLRRLRGRDLAALYVRRAELERVESEHHLFPDHFAVHGGGRRASSSSSPSPGQSHFRQLDRRRVVGLARLGETSVHFLLDHHRDRSLALLGGSFLENAL